MDDGSLAEISDCVFALCTVTLPMLRGRECALENTMEGSNKIIWAIQAETEGGRDGAGGGSREQVRDVRCLAHFLLRAPVCSSAPRVPVPGWAATASP